MLSRSLVGRDCERTAPSDHVEPVQALHFLWSTCPRPSAWWRMLLLRALRPGGLVPTRGRRSEPAAAQPRPRPDRGRIPGGREARGSRPRDRRGRPEAPSEALTGRFRGAPDPVLATGFRAQVRLSPSRAGNPTPISVRLAPVHADTL